MEQSNRPNTKAAYRRQQQIEDCLYENLLRQPYQSISVADLCRQVGISRKAFYNHYHDKESCLCAIIDQVLRDAMLHLTQAMPDNSSAQDVACIYLDFWKTQKGLFDILIHNDLLHLLFLRNMEYVLREDTSTLLLLNTAELPADADILASYMSCLLTLVLQWYFRNFDTSTGEMAKKLLRIVYEPLLAPPEG